MIQFKQSEVKKKQSWAKQLRNMKRDQRWHLGVIGFQQSEHFMQHDKETGWGSEKL